VFNKLARICVALILFIPFPVLADHVPTQPPYNQSIALDTTTGDLTIGIYTSDGFEDSPPEKYTIWFTISDDTIDTSTAYCVSTSFGHTDNLVWNYYVFSLEDLQTYFENPYGTFRTQIRSDNDTDNSYSTLTTEQTITIPNQLPFVNLGEWTAPTTTCNDTSIPPPTPNNAINVSVNYQGEDVFFEWEYANNETVDAHSFHINYSYDNTNFTRVIIDDTSLREYTLSYEYIQTGTFYWNFSVCGDLDNGESCTESAANNFETTEYTPPTTTPPTTLAPAPPPEPPEPPEPYVDPYVIEDKEVIMDDGSVGTYSQSDIDDGTVERDNERQKNEELYGCYVTDIALERGDCDIPEEIVDTTDEEIDDWDTEYEEIEEEYDTEGEFSDDVVVVLEVDDDYEDEDIIELTEEEILELEKQMEIDAKALELEEELEIFEFESEEEAEEFIETYLEIEEYIEELDEFEIEEVIIEDIPEDIVIIIEEDIVEEIIEDELDKEIPGDDIVTEDTIPTEDILVEPIQEDVKEEPLELTEEEVAIEVAEIEEVIDVPIIEEELTEEEVVEVIEEYVEELETEEVIEVLEEVNDIGVQNLSQATEETQVVIQAVVEEVIEDVEELTEEQVEVVAEVLQVQTEDVEIIAEAVKEDESVATAVEEYVERAVENEDVENYTLADVVTEVQFEEFIDNPIEVLTDIDISNISITNISDDMTSDQKEKAQEVVVPVILTRIASMAAFVFRRG